MQLIHGDVQSLPERMLGMVWADSGRAYRLWGLALATVMGVILGLRLFIGCPVIGYALHDSIWILAEGQQIVAGQMPHCDYFAFHGIAPFLLVAAGICLVGCHGLAITVGYALFTPLIVGAAWLLARKRLTAPLAALVSFMLGVVLMSTSAPGGLSGSHAMIYNRFGWVMLSLVAVQSLIPPNRSLSMRRSALEGAFTGFALACLEFTKLNYFGGGIVMFALGAMLFAHARRSAAAAVLGLLVGNAFFLAFLRFNAAAYWNNLTAVCAEVAPSDRIALVGGILQKNILFLVLACVPLAVACKLIARQKVAQRRARGGVRAIVASLAMLALGLLICAMNHQEFGVVTSAVATVALAEVCRRESAAAAAGNDKNQDGISCLAAYLAAVLCFVPVLGMDLAAIGMSLQKKVCSSRRELEEASLHSSRLSDFVSPARSGDAHGREEVIRAVTAGRILNPHHMAAVLNDGIDLVKPYVGDEDRVYCLDLDNLFPLALGIPYARGDAGWHANMSKTAYPDPERFLRGITFVMQPKQLVYPGAQEPMQQLFGATIEAQFEKVAESEFWIVWRRTVR
ncbi:MAG: hypothetical protein ACLP9L_35090 [Thermoguttaceae bacterium]